MAFEDGQHSESSSSGEEDEESDSTGTRSTVSCNSAQLTTTNDPLTLNGIGTINMENCQDSHIGTRIVADNLNIILNNPKDLGLVEQIVKPSHLPYYENLDWERKIGDSRFGRNIVTDESLENPSFSWKYKNKRNPFSYIQSCSKRALMMLLGILILIIMVVTMAILFGRKSTNGGRNTAPTVPPTSSTVTPRTLPTDDGHTTTYEPTPRPVVGSSSAGVRGAAENRQLLPSGII
uniref:Protein pad-1 n=1 Tax=Lygus hesperus TaxID=30085 RepID=A0A0A9WIX1_LYGHE